jgi:hypothetical protein
LTIAEDGVVDDYAVDGVVVVGVDEGVFEEFAVDFAEVEGEATGRVSTYSHEMPQYSMGESSKSTNMLTFQYKSFPSILRTRGRQGQSSRGSQQAAVCVRSCLDHLSPPP